MPPDPAGVVMVTEQEPADRVHVIGDGSSAASLVKVTVPVGTMAVPTSVSVTVAIQVEACPTVTGLVQLTVVIVERLLTVMDAAALVLVRWEASPPYAPVTVAVPVAVPVKVTEQLPADNAQLEALREPAPVEVKVTVPVGVMVVPTSVSVMVAVQVEAWLMTTGLVHVTFVEVERLLTVIVLEVPLLPK